MRTAANFLAGKSAGYEELESMVSQSLDPTMSHLQTLKTQREETYNFGNAPLVT
jgi:hypothetical protein